MFYNLLLTVKKEKYRRSIYKTKREIVGNVVKHEELSLAERREFILKQELVSAQRKMLGLEKELKYVQGTLKEKNETLMHFNQEKATRAHRMIELEARLKKYSAIDKLDITLMKEELDDKEKELIELRKINKKNKLEIKAITETSRYRARILEKSLKDKELEKIVIMKQIEELQQNIEAAKNKREDILWIDKYKELLEYSRVLKAQNQTLRYKIQEGRQETIVEYKRRSLKTWLNQYINPLISRSSIRRMYITGTSTDPYSMKKPLNIIKDKDLKGNNGRNSSLEYKTTFDQSFIPPHILTGSTTKDKKLRKVVVFK